MAKGVCYQEKLKDKKLPFIRTYRDKEKKTNHIKFCDIKAKEYKEKGKLTKKNYLTIRRLYENKMVELEGKNLKNMLSPSERELYNEIENANAKIEELYNDAQTITQPNKTKLKF